MLLVADIFLGPSNCGLFWKLNRNHPMNGLCLEETFSIQKLKCMRDSIKYIAWREEYARNVQFLFNMCRFKSIRQQPV